jgi:hypothetical protein
MDVKTQTQTQNIKPTNANKSAVDGLTLGRAKRMQDVERRKKLTDRQRFVEDLQGATNRTARIIGSQRGALIGVMRRGLASDALTTSDCRKALEFLQGQLKALENVIEKTEPEAQGFTV